MKIILSPSKTMNLQAMKPSTLNHNPLDLDLSLKLFKYLKQTSKKELSKVMKLTGDLLLETYTLYQSFDHTQAQFASIHLYTGLAFRELHLDEYSIDEWAYLESNLRILSAMYGVLTPLTCIWPYRLDFTHRFKRFSPIQLWKNKIPEAFKDEDLIINLASEEFSSLLKPLYPKMHTVHFLEFIQGQEKSVSANSKKARGKLTHLMIKHQIMDVESLQALDLSPYVLQTHRSNECESIYLKGQ